MNHRSYNQFCALASALDIVGERWNLLIIRELLPGPRRYKDLIDGLPGISTNLLSERLKSLEQQGVVCRRVLPPPAGSTVYELTAAGQALESSVLELGKWGSRWLPALLEGLCPPSMGAITLALKAFFHAKEAQGINAAYTLRLGPEALQIHVRDGALHVQQGAAAQPDAVFHTDMPSFLGVFTGQLQPDDAVAAGFIRVEGNPDALRQFLSVCRVPDPHSST